MSIKEDAVKTAIAAIEKAAESDMKAGMEALARVLIETIEPFLSDISDNTKAGKSDILKALSEMKLPTPVINVKVPDIFVPKVVIPEIKLPKIVVPEPRVTVNVPKQEAPIVNMEMPDVMPVSIEGLSNKNPLPVIMVDLKGRPMSMGMGGGAGGGGRAVGPELAMQSAKISVATTTELVAAVTGKSIRVVGFSLQANGTVAAKFTDGTNDKTGAFSFQDREGMTSPSISYPYYLFEIPPGKGLTLNLSAGVTVVGFVSYFLS